MKNEIMNRVQDLPGAAESNANDGRHKAQKAQEMKSPFATLCFLAAVPLGKGSDVCKGTK